MAEAPAPTQQAATARPAVVDPTKTPSAVNLNAPFLISTTQKRDRWFKFLVYGAHGAGKTELCGSAVDCPEMGPVLMVDAESGDSTIESSPRIHNAEGLHHIKVENFIQVAKIQEFLKAYCSARDRGDKATMKKMFKFITGVDTEDPPAYRTVIIDSLSEVEAYCTYQILRMDPAKMLVEDGGMDVAGWPEFRRNYEMMKLLVRSFRDLPMHVLFVCPSGYTKDENSRQHYGPRMTGKLGSEIQGFMDVVGFLTVGQATEQGVEGARRLWIQPISGNGMPRFDAKNRRPQYDKAFMDNPTMATMMSDLGFLPSQAGAAK